MKSLTPQELKSWLDEGKTFQLIDVREEHEREICSIGGESIPMATIINKANAIRTDCPVVIHCRSGKRSSSVIDALERHHGFDNLYNLNGGILAYAEEIDSSLETY